METGDSVNERWNTLEEISFGKNRGVIDGNDKKIRIVKIEQPDGVTLKRAVANLLLLKVKNDGVRPTTKFYSQPNLGQVELRLLVNCVAKVH